MYCVDYRRRDSETRILEIAKLFTSQCSRMAKGIDGGECLEYFRNVEDKDLFKK